MILLASLFLGLSAQATSLAVPKPVNGITDLHNHMFAEYAFGGAWLHGTVEGEISQALASCEVHTDPMSILGDHARVRIPYVSRLIGKTLGSSGDTGNHADHYEGYPNFGGWPRWDTIAHQQVWEGHLKTAHEAGLNLLIVSLVNYEVFCELMPEENMKYADCSDGAAIERQLDAARRFERNHDWFKIVTSAKEARDAIARGKLAVILSIEATHIFGDQDWRPQFEKVYQSGVRTLQMAHQQDNRFAGVALHNPIFQIIAWIQDFKKNGKWWEIIHPSKFGFKYQEDPKTGTKLNIAGITNEGRALIFTQMKRGMPIDLAHLSEKTIQEIEAITRAHENYPVYMSHGHFRDAMNDGKFSVWEKSSSQNTLEFIKRSQGVFGLRTGPEKTKDFPNSSAPNDCQGSSKSFAQTYQYGVNQGLHVGFGSDFNGFIQQTRPRFGNKLETCGAETDPLLRTQQQMAQKNPLQKRFDQSGLGDMSQLPDLLSEIKGYGVNTQELESSAEAYISMWERAEKIAKSIQ
jgi:hypothetical protein